MAVKTNNGWISINGLITSSRGFDNLHVQTPRGKQRVLAFPGSTGGTVTSDVLPRLVGVGHIVQTGAATLGISTLVEIH